MLIIFKPVKGTHNALNWNLFFIIIIVSVLKGTLSRHRFKIARFQKHILQQRKLTNTGPLLIKITMAVL